LEQNSVIIITDVNDFARDVIAHWQMQRSVPAFTAFAGESWDSGLRPSAELAIVGPVNGKRSTILGDLERKGMTSMCLVDETDSRNQLQHDHPRTLFILKQDGWLETVALIGAIELKLSEAIERAKKAESGLQEASHFATLGRNMLEMRHGMNNCLTGVLGNAELLLMDTEKLTPEMQEQLQTIHSMAMRMHEMMQRFSSLETEMLFAEKHSHIDTKGRKPAYVSGS